MGLLTDMLGGSNTASEAYVDAAIENAASTHGSALSIGAKSGRYYTPQLGNHATNAATVDRLELVPMWVPKALTVDRLAIWVSAATATAVCRLGIYASGTDLYPSTLVLDAGTVDCSTTGAKEVTISQALNGGLYWLASVSQVAAATMFCNSSSSGNVPSVGLGSLGNISVLALAALGVTGALPASAPALGDGNQFPTRVFVRIA